MKKSIVIFNKNVMSKFNLFTKSAVRFNSESKTSGTIQTRNSKGHFEKKVNFKVEYYCPKYSKR